MRLSATVNAKGAVLLGRHIACDGFDEAKPIRVVTHAHSDHMFGLRRSLKRCESVVMTPATKDLIDAMKGPNFLRSGQVKTLDYEEPLTYDGNTLSLRYSNHILGSAQVLVEDQKGSRVLYTGDFKMAKTPVVKADILVLEATYGNPYQVRPFGMMAEGILVSLVEQGLKRGPVYIFGYNGKIQEVMQILFHAKVMAPLVVSQKILQISKVCEKHGMRLGDRYILFNDETAQAIQQKSDPCVVFCHTNSFRKWGNNGLRILTSGWQFVKPCQRTGKREYRVALSDHSDFNELLDYVKKCRPKRVLTDNYRSGAASSLAKEIERRLNIPARPVPTKWK